MEWRMVIFSSLTSTSFTRRRTMRWRSGMSQGCGGCAQARQKACQGLGDPQIGLPVLGLVDNGLQFAMQSLLLTAQLGHSGAQFVDGDQLFLIGVDQTVDALADPDQAVPQVDLVRAVFRDRRWSRWPLRRAGAPDASHTYAAFGGSCRNRLSPYTPGCAASPTPSIVPSANPRWTWAPRAH